MSEVKKENLTLIKENLSKRELAKYLENRPKEIIAYFKSIGLEHFNPIQDIIQFKYEEQGYLLAIESTSYSLYSLNSRFDDTEENVRPSGFILSNNNYLQFDEKILIDKSSSPYNVYIFEYNYHFGVSISQENRDDYFFRYDKELTKRDDAEKKPVHHLHVCYSNPHFKTEFMTFDEVLKVIKKNLVDIEENSKRAASLSEK